MRTICTLSFLRLLTFTVYWFTFRVKCRIKKLYTFEYNFCTQQVLSHISVLRKPVHEYLNLSEGKIAVDCTVGLGGHTHDMLESVGSTGKVFGFDQDGDHLQFAKDRLSSFSNVNLIHRNFVFLQEELEQRDVTRVDAILFDLGLASPHVDLPERGFSFLKEGPLDMRFDQTDRRTAADIVNNSSFTQLVRIFRDYGEERFAARLAKAIMLERRKQPFQTTKQFADFVSSVLPKEPRKHMSFHPATRVFQALRIAVNEELDVLPTALTQAISLLSPKGRIVVISYHSLEDRIVKNIFRDESKGCLCPTEIFVCECGHTPRIEILTKKPVTPDETEIRDNPRSRSAKLRAIQKIS